MPYDNEGLDDAAEAKKQQPCQQNTRNQERGLEFISPSQGETLLTP